MKQLLHENLSISAARWPDRDAFRSSGQTVTFRKLDEMSSRLAALLVANGVDKGDRVAVRLPAGIQSPISVYAVLKAGGAMVPIDPHTPSHRLVDILAAGEIRCLITNHLSSADSKAISGSAAQCSLVIGDGNAEVTGARQFDWQGVAQQSISSPVVVTPEDVAYVIFTSGSTGTPKGIVHTHFSGQSYARLSAKTYQVTERDRIANLSPLHFDMSTFGYFTSVLAGATCVLVPPSYSMLPASLSSLVESERITIWYSVPFALVQLLQRGVPEQRDLSSIRWIMYGGEPLAPRYAQQLRMLMPNAWISNVYGPAEVNQCTYHHIPPAKNSGVQELADRPIPIGRIWDETEGRIFDSNGDQVPAGEPGELLIHSSTMMQRYWHGQSDDPSVFYIDSTSGRRFYRTGDRVRRNTDGELEFLSRMDRQVKIRGYRIELDEIERLLQRCSGVQEAAVISVQQGTEKELVATVTPVPGQVDLDSQLMKQFLMERLPAYAIPAQINTIDAFPRTTTGKIDRRALALHATGIARFAPRES